MTASPQGLQRPFYLDGMELGVADFVSERDYFDRLRRLYNCDLHTWGIASGLEVTIGVDGHSLAVSAGLAIDPSGREILLERATVVPNPPVISQRASLFVHCDAEASSVSQASLARGYTRVDYVPAFSFVPHGGSIPPQAVFLATAVLGAKGETDSLEQEARHYCGFDLGTLELLRPADGSVAAGIATVMESDSPQLGIDAATLRFSGLLEIAGMLSIGRRYPRATLDIVSGDPTLVAATNTGGAALFTVRGVGPSSSGQSSIGANPPAAPTTRLAVTGNIDLDANQAILLDGAGTLQSQSYPLKLALGPAAMQFVDAGKVADGGQITLTAGAGSKDASVPTMSFIANGNVGIREPKPAWALSVNGPIQSLQGGFEIGDNVQPTAAVSTTVPVGGIVDWFPPPGVSAPPPQFMICNGSPITQGPLKGNSTPNLVGYYVQGTTDFVAIGRTGGAASHTHQINALPLHTHGIQHFHDNVTRSTQSDATSGDSDTTDSKCSRTSHTHSIDILVAVCPESDSLQNDPTIPPVTTVAADNLPPTMGLVKIMRIL